MAIMLSNLAGIPQQVESQAPVRQDMDILGGIGQLQGIARQSYDLRNPQQAQAQESGLSVAERKYMAERSPEAQDAMRRYNEGLGSIYELGRQGMAESDPTIVEAYKGLAVASSDYYAATGKPLRVPSFSQIVNASANEMRARGVEADVAGKEYGLQTAKSKETAQAVKYVDDQVDKAISRKSKLIDDMRLIRKGASMLEQVAATDSPEQLFTVTKLLAQQIEPGMAVTEGEVRGFLGSNQATNVIQIVDSVKSGLGSLIGGANAQESAYSAGTGNAKAVQQLRTLAKQLSKQAQAAYRTMISEGVDQTAKMIQADVQTIYGGSVDGTALGEIKNRVASKLNVSLGTDTAIPITGGGTTAAPTTPAPKKAVSPAPAPAPKSGRTGRVAM